ncbi:chromosome segregation protein SMC [Mucilaginibacter daejeonensis]|uniref:chromosome segregation protein SMC n=1 Tax=Mucilaginibacter daejeonensis TaxID=398049 RepID=UPI001D172DC7|nr:chromosome segregation protein SMC [Mucilaginibacter daejeonensis]UEG55376.1 chromosome segregation protein SMC [Mucilaginibacter daejeonensis]
MQLTKLEVKGFKSFGDKITINFDEGVTAIVGPNGCGKSNVVDSIRWVLGEQSTRALRSEKMENIIFNGTKSRKPANLAEVSLTFDNTKNVLPTEFSQVTLTRKLYRTGESEYRLNDVQCRLKDITDLFLDTGIGSDSYSIIELKMIDEIITNKEGSRRNLFEEASGISKYKLRKKQTFNKLKDTEADLERVQDLLFEIEKNLKTLENQAKKTERYYRLKDQYKSLSIMLASFRIVSFSESLVRIEEQEQKHREERSGITTRIDTLEATLQQQKLDNLTREKNLSLQQKTTNEFISKIRAYESEKKIKNEQLKFQRDKESRLTEELERDKNQLNHVLYNIKRLNEEKLQEEENLQTITSKVADLKQAVDDLRQDQAALRGELNELTSINNRLQNQIYQTEKDLDILRIQQQALEQESQRNMEDTASREVELSHFNQLVAELESRTGTAESEMQAAVEFEAQLQQQIRDTDDEINLTKDQLSKQSRQLDAKQNEYNLTKSMVDNLEGFPESIRFLKKQADWAKNVPLFSDILFCQEDYRITIENYLEPLMNYFVVEDRESAIKAIGLLRNASRGRAQFFILNEFKDLANGPVHVQQGWVPALQVIEVDARYRPLCDHLLRNVYLIDDTAETALNASPVPDDVVLLGTSGKFSKTRLIMAGGSVGLFEGKRIGRAKNLENLAKEIRQSEQQIGQLKASQETLQSKLAALKASGKAPDILQKQQELNRLHTELVTVTTRREQYQTFITNSRNRKDDIARKIATIQEDEQKLIPQLAELRTQKEIQSDQLLDKQQAFNELNEYTTVQSNAYNQENIRFHQQQNKVSGLVKDLEYRESQQDNLEGRIRTNSAEMEKVQAALLETLQHSDLSDDELLDMYTQREALEKATKTAEEEYYKGRGAINETENDIALLRRQKDQADVIENDLKDKRNNLKLELNALKERLAVEFSIDINDLMETEVPADESEQDLRERTDKLKKQLDDFGAINPMALEAFQEMNERYEFIQNQKKDLMEAKASLLSTIQEIDDTAKEKFMGAFTLVRENFIKVFRSLFNEEDSCDLILTEPDSPLESDIDIIAKPKGKRPLSINQLSGGEKTLTATAILFSLYLLKPAPFCIFDEVDAPLDDTNIDKFNNIIRKFSSSSQFIIVSHNKRTIASTDVVYGVTMVEQGISRVVPVDLRQLADQPAA